MKTSTERAIKPMTVTGEYITKQARIVCYGKGFGAACDFLQELIPTMTLEQCEMICRKRARLTGVSPAVNYEKVARNENQ